MSADAYDIRNPPMMVCGHAANAVSTHDGQRVPSCVICMTFEQAPERPDLTGRKAKCAYGDRTVDSSWSLPFFEYQGPGTQYTRHCAAPTPRRRDGIGPDQTCGFYDTAHGEVNPATGRAGITAHEFVPRPPSEIDRYYCGCHGWD